MGSSQPAERDAYVAILHCIGRRQLARAVKTAATSSVCRASGRTKAKKLALATFFFCTDKETGRAGWHRAGQHLIYFASGKLKLKESKRGGGGWIYRQAAGRFGAGCASEMPITDRDSIPPCFF